MPRPLSQHLPSSIVSSLLLLTSLICFSAIPSLAQERLTLAARGGGSGPLADTLAAITMSGLSDADFIELNLAVTSDEALIIFSQPTLDESTNVREIFPERTRADGRYHVVDFSLQEIRQLRRRVSEITESGDSAAFLSPALGISTLEETLGLLRTIEQRDNREIGIAPSLNHISTYTREGKDLSRLLISMLVTFDYDEKQPVMLISNDGDALQRVEEELLPMYGLDLPLVQRIEENSGNALNRLTSSSVPDTSWIFTRLGLRMVSSYADALLLPGTFLHKGLPSPLPVGFLDDARALDLELFVAADGSSPEQLPDFATNYDELLGYYFNELGMNGVLTARPLKTLTYLEQLAAKEAEELKQQEESQISPLSAYLERQALEEEQREQSMTTHL